MTEPTQALRRRVRLTAAGVAVAFVALIVGGVYLQPDRFATPWDGWPGWLSLQAERAVSVLLALWAVFGAGRWWLRWPLALGAVVAIMLATTYVKLPPTTVPSLFESILWVRLTSDLPLFVAALLMGMIAYARGRRVGIAADDAAPWRFSLGEVFATMLLCSLLLLIVRWTAFQWETAFQFRGWLWGPRDGGPGSITDTAFVPMVVVNALGVALASFAALGAIATTRPRVLLIAPVIGLGYVVGLLAWLVQPSLIDRPGDVFWEGASTAMQTLLVVAALLALRPAGLRVERLAPDAPAVDDSPQRDTIAASEPRSPGDL